MDDPDLAAHSRKQLDRVESAPNRRERELQTLIREGLPVKDPSSPISHSVLALVSMEFRGASLHELGSPGQYKWGGFFYTGFTIDPIEDIVAGLYSPNSIQEPQTPQTRFTRSLTLR